jgi:MFS family permease
VVSFAGLPYTVLMPIFADRILHGGAQTLGVLMGATGLGALVGALLIASRTALKGFTIWIPVAAGGFAAALAGFSVSSTMWLSCATLFAAGFAVTIQVGASNTLIQSIVPDHLRGRAMSVYSMMYIGARMTILAGAAVVAAAAAFFALRLPAIRPGARQLIREQRARMEAAAEVVG